MTVGPGASRPEAEAPPPKMPPIPAGTGDPRRVYFPELDGLRFVAFLLVFLFHQGIPQFSGWANGIIRGVAMLLPFDAAWSKRNLGFTIQEHGWVGVQLFFILSGFLITTLLLREEGRTGRIDLRAFWMRRILRIWPLYYWIVFLGFFPLAWWQGLFSAEAYRVQFRLHLPAFLVFLGNFSMGLVLPVWTDALSILWSLCVEEQFYVFGPLLLVFVPGRARIGVVILLMGLAIWGRWWLAQVGGNPLLFSFNTLTQLDTLLSGVLLALVLDRDGAWTWARRWSRWMGWPSLIAAAWLLVRPGLARGDLAQKTWDYVLLWAVGCSILTVQLAGEGWFHGLLSHRWIVWLGRISYGLYMYHILGIMLSRGISSALGWFPNQEILTTIGGFALTVGMAAASYRWLETPFLKLKARWSRVPSRPI